MTVVAEALLQTGPSNAWTSRECATSWGTDTVRRALVDGASPETIVAAWQPGLRAFGSLRANYLLY